jgi:hypothetical protein
VTNAAYYAATPQQKNGKPTAHRSKRGRSEILDGWVSTGRKMLKVL